MPSRIGTVRKTLPLSPQDVDDLRKLREHPAHAAALARLVPGHLGASPSEAALLHALMEAGLRAVQQEVEEVGYAQIAVDMQAAERKAMARRRQPSWADE